MAIRIKLWADYGSYPLWGVDEIDFKQEGIILWKQLRLELTPENSPFI